MRPDLICAVDVGTLSARAGIFAGDGTMLSRAEMPIELHQPRGDHAEHDSEGIWRAVCAAVRQARADAGAEADRIAAIGFDATCSLVVRDAAGRPVAVSPRAQARFDTISWIDHRAIAEAQELTATGHRVLDYVGGVMSPEMQTPKLLWLKRNNPATWAAAGQLFDLADFLAWRASGTPARSQCTLTAKWTYLAHAGGWQHDYLAAGGLGDVIAKGALPARATAVGAPVGRIQPEAARELGLMPHSVVAAGVIDAFAGALGTLGAVGEAIERQAALIAGTSSCVMGISADNRQVPGIWGPYFGAALPGQWLWEGGQSATGALLDHVIRLFGDGGKPDARAHRDIIERIGQLRAAEGDGFAAGIHVLPDFHGNRSPLGDPHARGIITGLSLDHSFDNLCRIYWRTAVAIALGVREIVDHLRAHGRSIDTLHVIGGHRWNPLLMELYAAATGVDIREPRTDDAVLLGTAMLAAAAGGLHGDLPAACAAMAPVSTLRRPGPGAARRYDRDYETFKALRALARR